MGVGVLGSAFWRSSVGAFNIRYSIFDIRFGVRPLGRSTFDIRYSTFVLAFSGMASPFQSQGMCC